MAPALENRTLDLSRELELTMKPSAVLSASVGGNEKEGPATSCRVTQPFGIAFESQDNMYVVVSERVLRLYLTRR